jgi:hypothetical protein
MDPWHVTPTAQQPSVLIVHFFFQFTNTPCHSADLEDSERINNNSNNSKHQALVQLRTPLEVVLASHSRPRLAQEDLDRRLLQVDSALPLPRLGLVDKLPCLAKISSSKSLHLEREALVQVRILVNLLISE